MTDAVIDNFDDNKDENKNDPSYDHRFARIHQNIKNRLHLTQSFNRFKSKQKFSISAQGAVEKPGIIVSQYCVCY